MTVLSAVQDASRRLVGYAPSVLFASTDQIDIELRSLANEAAKAISKAHDWRKLTTLHTLTGDGSTTSFALPTDFDRMPLKSNPYSTRSEIALARARDTDQWLEFQITGVVGYPGFWIILGGNMQILPALATGELVKFYYQSTYIVSGSKTEFTADTDTFQLSERLLTLGIIWRWLQLKRMEYAEDMRNFELAFAEEAGRDKGSRMLTMGKQRTPFGVELAYPIPVTP